MNRRELTKGCAIPILFVIDIVIAVAQSPQPSAGPQRFADGVSIDWHRRKVHVEGRITLREGQLELFACSPRTREHESIVVLDARPMHVFQALGLLGLEAGAPMRYDPETEKWIPPRGEELRVRVRHERDGVTFTDPPEHWMIRTDTKKPPDAIRWVFCGSRTLGNGAFGADSEGTVLALVDFDTALIAVDTLHTSENAALWLAANPDTIPPLGSRCTLLIESMNAKDRGEISISVASDGQLRQEDKTISTSEILKLFPTPKGRSKRARLIVLPDPGVELDIVKRAARELLDAGLDPLDLEVQASRATAQSAKAKSEIAPG